MKELTIPNLTNMSDEEVKAWIATLTTPTVYKHMATLVDIIVNRFGNNASVTTSTYGQPKVVYLVADMD